MKQVLWRDLGVGRVLSCGTSVRERMTSGVENVHPRWPCRAHGTRGVVRSAFGASLWATWGPHATGGGVRVSARRGGVGPGLRCAATPTRARWRVGEGPEDHTQARTQDLIDVGNGCLSASPWQLNVQYRARGSVRTHRSLRSAHKSNRAR